MASIIAVVFLNGSVFGVFNKYYHLLECPAADVRGLRQLSAMKALRMGSGQYKLVSLD
ncbi:MAG: hypothetical protein IJT01_09645 [Selenomonadaceae bacterium]|nr:hypothetical protein [Selenomonadaceae bacterium]